MTEWVQNGPVRVCFDYIGEGVSGDYDPTDPNDRALLRLDAQVHSAQNYGGEETDDPNWLYPQDGSICTCVGASTPATRQRELLVMIAADLRGVVERDESVKHAMDRYSYIHENVQGIPWIEGA